MSSLTKGACGLVPRLTAAFEQRSAKRAHIVHHDRERRRIDRWFASGPAPRQSDGRGSRRASMARRDQTIFKKSGRVFVPTPRRLVSVEAGGGLTPRETDAERAVSTCGNGVERGPREARGRIQAECPRFRRRPGARNRRPADAEARPPPVSAQAWSRRARSEPPQAKRATSSEEIPPRVTKPENDEAKKKPGTRPGLFTRRRSINDDRSPS